MAVASRFSRLRAALADEPVLAFAANHLHLVRTQLRGGELRLAPPRLRASTRYMRPYLATSLTHRERRAISLAQSRFLQARIGRGFFDRLHAGPLGLWEGAGGYRIALALTHDRHGEGDLRLAFELGPRILYEISFSIGPPAPLEDAAATALLVARVQGTRGALEAIKTATASLGGVTPPTLLMAALEGVALALGIERICAVSDREQLFKGGAEDPDIPFRYDAFFEPFASRCCARWRHLDVPIAHKPLASVSPAHRRRAKRRRAVRDAVSAGVKAALEAAFPRLRDPTDRSRP